MTLWDFNHIFSHSNYLETRQMCVSLCGKGFVQKDNRLIRFSQRLKEGRKWLSVHPSLSGLIPPVAAERVPSIWSGA